MSCSLSKKLSSVVLACFTISSFVGCTSGSPNSSSAPAAPTDTIVEGGVNGGGGGTLPADLPEVIDVSMSIGGAYRSLYSILLVEQARSHGTGALNYLADPKFALLLSQTPIETLEDRPCKDLNGNDVDGSVNSSLPNGICISAFSIAKKVSKYAIDEEVIALVAHELSHKLGANEPEAREIQKEIFEWANMDVHAMNLLTWETDVRSRLNELSAVSRESQAATADDILYIGLQSRLATAFGNFVSQATGVRSIFTKKEANYLDVVAARLFLATLQSDFNETTVNDNTKDFFAGKNEITYCEYLAHLSPASTCNNQFGGLKIKNIRARAEMEDLISGVSKTISESARIALRRTYHFPELDSLTYESN